MEAKLKSLLLDPVLRTKEIRSEKYGELIDKVTDVFECMMTLQFQESQIIRTPKFREAARTVAVNNLTECRKMCASRNKSPDVLERVAYLCLVLERFIALLI